MDALMVSTVPTWSPEQFSNIFIFRFKKNFFDISVSKGHRDATMVSTAPRRSPEQCANIFILRFKKNCCDKVARTRRRSHRHQRGPLNSLRSFLFFAPKKISSISRFSKVTGTRRGCQRHLRSPVTSVQIFTYCGSKEIAAIRSHGSDGEVIGTNAVP